MIGIDDSDHSGDRFAEIVAGNWRYKRSAEWVSFFWDRFPSILLAALSSTHLFRPCDSYLPLFLGYQRNGETHILVSFEAAPPEIFWTRSWPSSVFNSSSCFIRSSLFFPQSWPVLILAVDYEITKMSVTFTPPLAR